jgi:ubiquinone/menaquinone biosynthesis C-methylase UbiE
MSQLIVSNDSGKRRIIFEFDSKADIYDSNKISGWYHAHNDSIFEMLDFGANDTLLDVGCATGYLLNRALNADFDVSVIGVDLSPKMISTAERTITEQFPGRSQFFCDDWEAPSPALVATLSDHHISHITCASVLHYFSDPLAALRRMRDALAPGGTVFLLERRLEGSLPTKVWHLAHQHLINDHVHFYGRGALLSMLEKAGFSQADEIQHIKKYFWHNKMITNLTLIKAVR